jgi:hypothetical protein
VTVSALDAEWQRLREGLTPKVLARLEALRGWTPAALERLGIGFDGERVVIPVRDETGGLLSFLRYSPTGVTPKMLAEAGATRELFPPPEMIGDDEHGGLLFLDEGEPDTIALWSLGLAAVGVPGTGKWGSGWAARFSGRRWKVVVCFDCDTSGRSCAAEVAQALLAEGVDVRVLDLDPSRDDGFDLSDYLAGAVSIEERNEAAHMLRTRAQALPLFAPSAVSVSFPSTSSGKGNGPGHRTVSEEGWRLPFAPLAVKLANVPEEPDWFWEGFVCPTVLTLLAGLPKVGKSTLLFGMLRALRDGDAFLGAPTRPTRALLLTEEREVTLAQKRTLLGLDGDDDLHVLMRWEARDAGWEEVVAQATVYALAHGLGVLIIDTLDKWLPLVGESAENDAGAIVRSLLPLLEAASAGLAVILVTHHRKGEGRHGERVRGSTALTGAADVIVELERARGAFGEEGGRVLSGTSRFQSTPETIALELTEGTFVAVGSAEEGEARAEQATILAVLRGGPLTRDEVKDALIAAEGSAMRGETLALRLRQMVASGTVVRSGRGKKGDPYRWTLAPSPILPSPGNGGNGITGDEVNRRADLGPSMRVDEEGAS